MTAQIISALPLPFTDDGAVDWSAYEALLARVEPHVHGVLVAGTTGEFPALDDDERLETFRRAIVAFGADRVIAHIGHASPQQVIRLGHTAQRLGISRMATLNPYYLPADDDAVYGFYQAVTAALPGVDHYVYLFPERTGITVGVAVFERIMQLPGVRGVKLSGAASEELEAYAKCLVPGQELYSGNDATLPFVMASGGSGVVSGVSAAFPATFAALARAVDASGAEETKALQDTVENLVSLAGPSIIRLKAAVAVNVPGSWRSRMPMAAIDGALATELSAAAASHA
ncbi:dihydrodipicolinate synthase family protein [Arthrobacter luteolus]|uniref:dihydrodipicolinate synthase family protein n=1 Tax=Arthrobacter luteolus TaxID=98672 RepID=UPI00082C7C01|nr:dihydrodipicolinate synthase family protein [Arthrobacter luteolus]